MKGARSMSDNASIIGLLKKEMVTAMGCTEPAAAALAGSKARELLDCVPEKLTVYASRDMIKNAMAVGIPNCEERGILTAVCLGVFSECRVKDLSILSAVTDAQRSNAAKLSTASRLELAEGTDPVYVKVEATAGEHKSVCVISGEHDRISDMQKDGNHIQITAQPGCQVGDEVSNILNSMSLADVIDFVTDADMGELRFVMESAETNYALAKHSVETGYGLHVANALLEDMPARPGTLHEAMTFATAYAAAGSDARMSGCPKAVVINSGSGNQGITCTVPVLMLGRYMNCNDDKIIEALCISELVGLMITARKDRLSALCGAFTAAMGAGCGMIWLMGGSLNEMNLVIRTMVGDLSGIVCDGAKTSCALKICSSLQAACLAVRLAMRGNAPGRESGIIGGDAMESIDNLMTMSHDGMVDTDKVILSIMLNK